MGFARSLLVLLVIFGIGLVGYQVGVSQNIAAQLPAVAAPGVPVAYYGYPYHFGFGFLGFLFPLFFLFLIFGLLRAAMFGGRGGWKGGYGGRGWGSYGRLEEIHRELHGDKPSDKTGGASGTAT
ncbi:MAG: hypothetical protein ABI888_07175 [Chloroflexota bacterium]